MCLLLFVNIFTQFLYAFVKENCSFFALTTYIPLISILSFLNPTIHNGSLFHNDSQPRNFLYVFAYIHTLSPFASEKIERASGVNEKTAAVWYQCICVFVNAKNFSFRKTGERSKQG